MDKYLAMTRFGSTEGLPTQNGMRGNRLGAHVRGGAGRVFYESIRSELPVLDNPSFPHSYQGKEPTFAREHVRHQVGRRA